MLILPPTPRLLLVELLVVIGIVALLISMLLPSLNKARESAKQVQCAAQLHQLGQGLANYASSNRGCYPTWSDWHIPGGDGTGEDTPGPGWMEVLEPYFAKPTSTVYNCPAFPEGYTMNYFLSARWINIARRPHLQASDIKLSSQFVLSGDCTQPRLYPPPFGIRSDKTLNDCDKDDATDEGILFFGQQGGLNVHHAGNNVLFADYHVAPFKRFEPESMTYNPKRMEDWEKVTGD